ncbi:MAG: rhomboid family intramembrane serine protease [Lachnospiraceae bacterium]|nr:rhomboid family intramembrane serine protease [Lachnospiraceae bacterium]
MKDRVLDTIESMGFRRIAVNVPNIYCHVGLNDDVAYIVVSLDCDRVQSVTGGLINNLVKSLETLVYNELQAKSYRSHFILMGYSPINVKNLFNNNESFWVLDFRNQRLQVYEYEDVFYTTLKKQLERVCFSENANSEAYAGSAGNDGYVDENSTYGQNVRFRNKDAKRGFINGINIAPVTMILLAVNVIIFLVTGVGELMGKDITYGVMALSWDKVMVDHEYYRLITSMFTHSGISHIGNNMLILVIMGTYLENTTGSLGYAVIYFASGFIADITSLYYHHMINSNVVSVGASGAIFGVVGAMLFLIIFFKGSIGGISKSQIIFMIFLNLYGGFAVSGIDNAAHIGGFVGGFVVCMLLQLIFNISKRGKRLIK